MGFSGDEGLIVRTFYRRRLQSRGGFAAIAAASVLMMGLLTPAMAEPAPVPRDGSTSDRAAASCWSIKQDFPALPSGVYWLQTPTLVAPQQFYCDQVTDGGGWVLVGRGRSGWSFEYNGQGPENDVSTTPSGVAAFIPRALPAATIDGLLGGARVDSLSDGIRLRRARDVAGTVYQEVRMRMADRAGWAWAFDAGQKIGAWSMDQVPTSTGTTTISGTSGLSSSLGTGTNYGRVSTTAAKAESYTKGFAYLSGATGSTASDSYIFKSGSTQRAFPFTQVFIRPRLRTSEMTYPVIPDAGTAPVTRRAMPDNNSLPQTWGVSGSGNGSELLFDDPVHAFAQAGSRMLVGGNFRYVQRGESATGGDKVEQPFLAAFDVSTGDWKTDFRPVLDGQVLAAETLPNGLVVVGGEFTTVNGVPQAGVAVIDPVTGQLAPWQIKLEERTSAPLHVRALERRNDLLYLGGSFTHIATSNRATFAFSRNASRVNLINGEQDLGWRPDLNGSVNAISPSADGSRAYLAGWFGVVNGTTKPRVATLSAADASLVPGQADATFSRPTGGTYQQAIREAGGRVWYGGSEHMLFSVDPANFQRLSGNIYNPKGDVQVISSHQGIVFASCHCGTFVYHDSYNWPSPIYEQADNANWVTAHDASTGELLPEFLPDGVVSRLGHGGWALEFDSQGTLWAGGDFT